MNLKNEGYNLCVGYARPAFYLQAVDKGCQRRSHVAQRLNVRAGVRFAPSLAAALLDSLSEQPAGDLDSVSHREDRPV